MSTSTLPSASIASFPTYRFTSQPARRSTIASPQRPDARLISVRQKILDGFRKISEAVLKRPGLSDATVGCQQHALLYGRRASPMKAIKPSRSTINTATAKLVRQIRPWDNQPLGRLSGHPRRHGPGDDGRLRLKIGQCDPISMTDGRWSSHHDDLIIIDDIYDTGRTFQDPAPQLSQCHLRGGLRQAARVGLCHYHGKLVEQDHWVIMPWPPMTRSTDKKTIKSMIREGKTVRNVKRCSSNRSLPRPARSPRMIDSKTVDIAVKDAKTGQDDLSQQAVKVPVNWSDHAAQILASKYFRKAGVPAKTISTNDPCTRGGLHKKTPA